MKVEKAKDNLNGKSTNCFKSKAMKDINKQLKSYIHRKTSTMDKKSVLIEKQENLNMSVMKSGKLMSSSIITCKSQKKTGILTNSANVTPQKAPDSKGPIKAEPLNASIANSRGGSLARHALASHLKKLSVVTDVEVEKRSESRQRRTRKDRKSEQRKNCQSMHSQYLLSPSGVSISAINLNDSLYDANGRTKRVANNESVLQRRVTLKGQKLGAWKNPNEKVRYLIEKPTNIIVKPVTKDIAVLTLRDLNAKRYIAKKYLGELYMRVVYKVKDLERNKKLMGPLRSVKGVVIDDQRQAKRSSSKTGQVSHRSHKSMQFDSRVKILK
eukprot:TRINITY_DN5118_c0_g1_i1.p1 TRINITY_DN5118_c0_g1~~TRINITY_DN5118_c0_g1_i1.p1  ORF type:complete len:327 (+),score=71.84 TRINITY_DN5118_c0_g1_i1:289-1269(+)